MDAYSKGKGIGKKGECTVRRKERGGDRKERRESLKRLEGRGGKAREGKVRG